MSRIVYCPNYATLNASACEVVKETEKTLTILDIPESGEKDLHARPKRVLKTDPVFETPLEAINHMISRCMRELDTINREQTSKMETLSKLRKAAQAIRAD